jgi:hypothetical protein
MHKYPEPIVSAIIFNADEKYFCVNFINGEISM